MVLFETSTDIRETLDGILQVHGNAVSVMDADSLRARRIDDLVYNALLHPSPDIRYYLHWLIHETAAELEIYPASIQGLYEGLGQQASNMTVPAFRVEALAYETARACFRAAHSTSTGAFIFQRSDGDWLGHAHSQLEFASAVLAAAIKERHLGSVFMQDNLAVDAERYRRDPLAEAEVFKDRLTDTLGAGFFNLLLDTAALADYTRPTFEAQQRESFVLAGELAAHVRDAEPATVISALGVAIGELCDRHRMANELRAFVEGFQSELEIRSAQAEGLAKIVLHTGVTQPTATQIPQPIVDFDLLKDLAEVARREYGLCIGVRGGLAPLPDEAFDLFPAVGVAEVQMATRFHDAVMDHTALPASLIGEMRQWVERQIARQPGERNEAYYARGLAIAQGPFQKRLWDVPEEARAEVMASVQERFAEMMRRLRVATTSGLVRDTIDIENIALPAPVEGYDQTAETRLADLLAHLPERAPFAR